MTDTHAATCMFVFLDGLLVIAIAPLTRYVYDNDEDLLSLNNTQRYSRK